MSAPGIREKALQGLKTRPADGKIDATLKGCA
jgi:hypothetical protein